MHVHILPSIILAAVTVVASALLKIARRQAEQARRREALRTLDDYFRRNVEAEHQQHS